MHFDAGASDLSAPSRSGPPLALSSCSYNNAHTLSLPPVLSCPCSEPANNGCTGMKTQVVLLLQIMNLKDEFALCSRYLYLKGFFFVMFGVVWGGLLFVFIAYLGSTVCGYNPDPLCEACTFGMGISI